MDEEEGLEEALGKDLAPALLRLDSQSKFLVVAVGTELRIFNFHENCPVSVKDVTEPSFHSDAVKTIAFDREGKLFVSAGDDKLVKLWDAHSWLCIKTVCANKKVNAATFSHDSQWLLYADKFGSVYAVSIRPNGDFVNAVLDQPVQLLAHCCSIITSLECSPNGRYIVTGDRDSKIRVSIFPKNPLKGAHEIQGFCLGHTSFVSCIAFLGEHGPTQFLVSGGGDGTVRLWDPDASLLLDTLHLDAGLMSGGDGSEPNQLCSITGISVSNGGSLIAVAVESLDGILFLQCNCKLKQLLLLQKVILSEHFCPTSVQFDKTGWLWMVAGAAEKLEGQKQSVVLHAENKASSLKAITCMKVLSTSLLSASNDVIQYGQLEVESIPGGKLLFKTIEGDLLGSDKALALADAANVALKNALLKRQYTHEHREYRKRMRNDRKLRS